MKRGFVLLSLLFFGQLGFTEVDFLDTPAPEPTPMEREPSAVPTPSVSKRSYPGAADEEDLQVQAHLPEAALKTDQRSLQHDVYKSLYNQELKDEGRESVEE